MIYINLNLLYKYFMNRTYSIEFVILWFVIHYVVETMFKKDNYGHVVYMICQWTRASVRWLTIYKPPNEIVLDNYWLITCTLYVCTCTFLPNGLGLIIVYLHIPVIPVMAVSPIHCIPGITLQVFNHPSKGIKVHVHSRVDCTCTCTSLYSIDCTPL